MLKAEPGRGACPRQKLFISRVPFLLAGADGGPRSPGHRAKARRGGGLLPQSANLFVTDCETDAILHHAEENADITDVKRGLYCLPTVWQTSY